MDIIEPLNTVQFTFVSSIAPDSAPNLLITDLVTAVNTITSISSGSTQYYALYTAPSSEGIYLGTWAAEKTISGSTYNFRKAFLFNVKQTRN